MVRAITDTPRQFGRWDNDGMFTRIHAWFRTRFPAKPRPEPRPRDSDYVLPDPEMTAYDHGVGTLKVDGELRGYLASTLMTMSFPRGEWWPWFVVVWLDGTKERSEEDYGPEWYTVRELDAGFYECHTQEGNLQRFEFARLPRDKAAVMWEQLGLTPHDF